MPQLNVGPMLTDLFGWLCVQITRLLKCKIPFKTKDTKVHFLQF